MITLDTSALIAMIDATDPGHTRVVESLNQARGPYVVPVSILSEATYLIEQNFGSVVLESFILALDEQQFALDCGHQDFSRIHALVARYRNLPLGFADAAVVACSERNGGLVATLDFRHFGVVAGEGTIQILPNS